MKGPDRTGAAAHRLQGRAFLSRDAALFGLLLAGFVTLVTSPAKAEECLGPIARRFGEARVMPAALRSDQVAISYVGHATFVIESPQGIRAATDYNDYVRPPFIPEIATMNHAHSTHYTMRPNPNIQHVLRGWSEDGRPSLHSVTLGDMHVRNVPTNIRAGGFGPTEYYGNSIFVFETAGLCVAHLGHLHHTLTPEHLAALGTIDVLLAAADGSWTMDYDGIVEVIGQIKPKIVIPMHFVTRSSLQRFLDRIGPLYPVERPGSDTTIVSRDTLPVATTVRVLEGGM